jgi:hypothetical protein
MERFLLATRYSPFATYTGTSLASFSSLAEVGVLAP